MHAWSQSSHATTVASAQMRNCLIEALSSLVHSADPVGNCAVLSGSAPQSTGVGISSKGRSADEMKASYREWHDCVYSASSL